MKIKKSLPYFLSMTLLVLLLSSFSLAEKQDAEKDDFRTTWENTKAYTLAVAEAMPADKFGFKPTEEVRDFGGQMKHISFSTYFMPGVFIEGKNIQFDPNYESNAQLVGGTKAEIIALLTERFDAVDKLVEGMSKKQLEETVILPFFNNKEVTKLELLKWINKHTGHHNAQAIVYLRMNGITPPAYNGW